PVVGARQPQPHPVADGYQDGDTDAHHDADGNLAAQRHPDIHAKLHAHADGDAGKDRDHCPVEYVAADRNAVADIHADTDSDDDPDGNDHADDHADTDGDCRAVQYGGQVADTVTHRHPYPDGHADADGESRAFAHADPDVDADTDANADAIVRSSTSGAVRVGARDRKVPGTFALPTSPSVPGRVET
ncbi:MAG: hypothetical protein EBS89_08195, partial [Proteobacteria bacterium]|nr:hypothetical protein [Pseudomonadota bacterium]